ncbi:MAG: malonate decarboxylase holo-ACP synthase [Terriglobia bacterium]
MDATCTSPRVHDLLRLDSPCVAQPSQAQPWWVAHALQDCPWVVVRRAVVPDSRIAVGVRGNERFLRWGGFVAHDQVGQALAPHQLRSCLAKKARLALPAMQTLRILEDAWRTFHLEWGPGGSVGYELATGMAAVGSKSDLDIVIHSSRRLEFATAERLLAAARALPALVDVRVETSACGFSLQEYVQCPARLLVRTPAGSRLAADPWSLEDE